MKHLLLLCFFLSVGFAQAQVVKSSSGSQSGEGNIAKKNFKDVSARIVGKANDNLARCFKGRVQKFQSIIGFSTKLIDLSNIDVIEKTLMDPECGENENLAYKKLLCLLPQKDLNDLRDMSLQRVNFIEFLLKHRGTDPRKAEAIADFYRDAFNVIDQREAGNRTYVPPGK